MTWANLMALWSDLFDGISLNASLNKDVLINTILDKCDVFESLYTTHDLLRMKIQNFFLKHQKTFDKITEASLLEYNMIENYDRQEEFLNTTSNTNKNLNKVSAFDSSDFSDESESSNDSTNISNNVGRTHGNIGVTTSQQMLESELQIRPKLNPYEFIATAFFDEFCIAVL